MTIGGAYRNFILISARVEPASGDTYEATLANIKTEGEDSLKWLEGCLTQPRTTATTKRTLTQFPPRNPKEIDDVLDTTAAMLAVAAVAAPPRWGIETRSSQELSVSTWGVGLPKPGTPFTWREGAQLASTAMLSLVTLQQIAGNDPSSFQLSGSQLRRMKVEMHWVRWLWDRARRGAAWPVSTADSSNLKDWFRQLGMPDPPPYPLEGDAQADVIWPWNPMPAYSDVSVLDPATLGDALPSASPSLALLSMGAADTYLTRGIGMFLLTGGYA